MSEQIDYEAVRRYFETAGAGASAAASYMAHASNLPASAVRYRHTLELKTIGDWLGEVPSGNSVLDVGCGAGAWTAVFAERYARVVGIEGSTSMVEAAKRRTAGATNVEILQGDVRSGLPQGEFQFVFVGGLCMYLNDDDALELLRSSQRRIGKDGVLMLRESTVVQRRRLAQGEYQAVYRTVADYRELIHRAGFTDVHVRRNAGYTRMEIAVELVEMRRRWLPFLPADSPKLAALTWWSLRAAAPISFWGIPRVLELLRIAWPPLQNHFFRLRQ